ncbi:MAG: hypothetical protein Ct9H300mP18_05000 [Candidatus Neomarinimicrobiota bacterium]|nr:MAG: hypothetical protein Ct9H300mP18_05000 [Candidatus Neomarinimicrobiota bacterium]
MKAKEHKVVIVLNLFELDNGQTYDSSPVINSDGNILGSTRMVHVADYKSFYEKSYYTEGEIMELQYMIQILGKNWCRYLL